MKTSNSVLKNRYQDSVTLMQVSLSLRAIAGIEEASLMMGTQPNKEILADAALLTAEGEAAGPNDLIVALRGTEQAGAEATARLEEMLRAAGTRGGVGAGAKAGATHVARPRSLLDGLAAMPAANFVLISTPGIYAAAEAHKAVTAGLHAMIFSDNVPVEDEVRLKTMAAERGLLLLGPDCGTAIIGGVPLGFANAVRRGSVGVVGASGTGMQEITALVDRYGGGISHAIGTGSRDLSAQVGGLATLAALTALQEDPSTKVIVLVSKPPDAAVASRLLAAAREAGKTVIACFLGLDAGSYGEVGTGRVVTAATLEDAARKAVQAITWGIQVDEAGPGAHALESAAAALKPGQRFVRGLFSGGTFCYEALLLLAPSLGPVLSNAPLDKAHSLPARSPHTPLPSAHVCLDLGADEYTVGRPHPMLDMSLRAERIVLEAADPEVAAILLDVVLGYGAHPDPAGILAPAIKEARRIARDHGRAMPVVLSICGTARDPQGYDSQKERLEAAGALVAPSNAAATRMVSAIVTRNPAQTREAQGGR